jgi:hypothetical protein
LLLFELFAFRLDGFFSLLVFELLELFEFDEAELSCLLVDSSLVFADGDDPFSEGRLISTATV